MLVLLSLAAAAPPPCATPEALDALRGLATPTHPAMTTAPARLDGRARANAAGKAVYGGHYEFYVDTANFTINWWDASIDPAAAEAAGEALEDAWAAFIVDQGWTPPVSSDRYLVWVLLDPQLGGTGYTTEYFTDEFPEGYPVLYLEPSWASQPAFWGSLAAHEFMHALQYALREWDGTDASEAWYWEASATWASELAEPDRDGYQYASAWYAEQADLAYDSMEGSHQYGMFVFNAWMEEQLTGPDGMHAVWEASETDGSPWDVLLADTTGEPVDALWGGFTGAYGNGLLAESAQYTAASLEGALEDGAAGTLPELGTHYWRATEPVIVTAAGDVVLSGPRGPEVALPLDVGDRLAVTAVSAGAYTLAVDTGDTDAPADEDADTGSAEEKAGGCACDAGGSGVAGLGLAWAAVATARRRRAPVQA